MASWWLTWSLCGLCWSKSLGLCSPWPQASCDWISGLNFCWSPKSIVSAANGFWSIFPFNTFWSVCARLYFDQQPGVTFLAWRQVCHWAKRVPLFTWLFAGLSCSQGLFHSILAPNPRPTQSLQHSHTAIKQNKGKIKKESKSQGTCHFGSKMTGMPSS